MKVFKLIVTSTDKCISVLKYIRGCIKEINDMGVKIQIEKISEKDFDEDMVSILARRGITRLPCLITSDGKPFIGIKDITTLIDKNLNILRGTNRVSVGRTAAENDNTNTEVGANPELADFWMGEMYGGRDNRGKLIPRKDPEDVDEDANDIDAKMRRYQSRVPKHRGGGSAVERDIEPEPKPRRRRAPVEEPMDDHNDNIRDTYDEPDDTPIRVPKLPPSGEGGDDLDQKMLAAWIDNNSEL